MSSIEIYTCTLGKLFRSVLKVEVTLCVNRGLRNMAPKRVGRRAVVQDKPMEERPGSGQSPESLAK